MPVANVIDRRKTNNFDVNSNVIFESSWHDNSVRGATQFEYVDPVEDECTYLGIRKTTVDLAIRYASQRWPDLSVTMYLYDPDICDYYDCEGLALDAASGQVTVVYD